MFEVVRKTYSRVWEQYSFQVDEDAINSFNAWIRNQLVPDWEYEDLTVDDTYALYMGENHPRENESIMVKGYAQPFETSLQDELRSWINDAVWEGYDYVIDSETEDWDDEVNLL